MASFEEELQLFQPVIQKLCGLSLFGKKVIMKGGQNFVREGPNIIIGNHCGSYKDVAILFKYVPRPIFFTANMTIFNRSEFNALVRKHLKRHMHNFGLFLDLLFSPIKAPFVDYISSNIHKIGTIPVDLNHKKRMAFRLCHDYLKKGKAIITLQGRGRVCSDHPHPYIYPFRRGASILTYNLFRDEKIQVPVTPVAFYGTQLPLIVPGKIMINIGEPMYIVDYMTDEASKTILNFKDALEKRVKALFYDIIRKKEAD